MQLLDSQNLVATFIPLVRCVVFIVFFSKHGRPIRNTLPNNRNYLPIITGSTARARIKKKVKVEVKVKKKAKVKAKVEKKS
jgi:hypothetical protein